MRLWLNLELWNCLQGWSKGKMCWILGQSQVEHKGGQVRTRHQEGCQVTESHTKQQGIVLDKIQVKWSSKKKDKVTKAKVLKSHRHRKGIMKNAFWIYRPNWQEGPVLKSLNPLSYYAPLSGWRTQHWKWILTTPSKYGRVTNYHYCVVLSSPEAGAERNILEYSSF